VGETTGSGLLVAGGQRMTHKQATASAEKKLLARRLALTRQRTENDASVLELNAAKRLDDLAENDEIAGVEALLSDQEKLELAEVEAGLERVRKGTWGTCEVCGRAIDGARLTAVPEARTCVDCTRSNP
jgi:DnaK suppressor protein